MPGHRDPHDQPSGQPQNPAEPAGQKMQVQEMAQMAGEKLYQLQYRREFNRQYTTNEDFGKMFPDYKRLAIVGCTGAGKSALLNKLGGFRMEYNEKEGQYVWDEPDRLIFCSEASTTSVTRFTTFANVHYLGFPEKPCVVIDTPGHDDTDPDMLTEQASDLNVKLQAMGYVNAILILHKDFVSNRLDPATYDLLKKISTIFQKSGKNVWEHIILGYSRVDEEQRTWRSGLEEKKKAFQQALKTETLRQGFECPCKIDVPIICLSSYEDSRSAAPLGDLPFEDEDPQHPCAKRITQRDGFMQLWNFLQDCGKLRCEELQVYEGLEERFRKAVIARDQNARIAAARKHFMSTAMNCGVILLILLLRPGLFNVEGVWDELLLLGGFIYVSGLYLVWDFMRVLWDDYFLPKLEQSPLADKVPLGRMRLLGELEGQQAAGGSKVE